MVQNNNYEHIESSYFDTEFDKNNSMNLKDTKDLFKGSHVVLVNEENPWYINKGVPQKYISYSEFAKEEGVQRMMLYEIYQPNQKELTEDPSKSYSRLQRKLQTEIEGFNMDKSDMMNRNILVIILIILLGIFIYRIYKRKHI